MPAFLSDALLALSSIRRPAPDATFSGGPNRAILEPDPISLGGPAFTTSTVTATIQRELERLEHEEGVRVLYACESGSRAWGFASQDSDYDMRFIYIRPVDFYLSLGQKRDVLERMLPDDLDLAGWDLPKALRLFAKSNPPLLEWLDSPIIYRQEPAFTDALKALLPSYYAPRACRYHYLNTAKKNYSRYLQGDRVRLKKYLYVLRPVLACRWLEAGYGPVPMAMQTLVDRLLPDGEYRDALQALLDRKRQGDELDYAPRVRVLDKLIEGALTQLEDAPKTQPQPRVEMTALDELFRDTLRRYGPVQT